MENIFQNATKSARYTVKVHFDNGDSLVTDINGTPRSITNYYLGRDFNLGDGAGGDLIATARKVDFLEAA